MSDNPLWENVLGLFTNLNAHSNFLHSTSANIAHYVKDSLLQHPVIYGAVILTLAYFLWYHIYIVRHPLLYGGAGGLKKYLVKHCTVFTQPYRPTFWAWHHFGTTILRSLMQRLIPVSYDRQIVHLSDGGHLALDWAQSHDEDSSTKPIFLIVPGLTGNSHINYIVHFVQDGLAQGYRPVVLNHRGMGDLLIKTPLIASASNIEDLELVLDTIQSQYPQTPIIVAGISLGGLIVTQYLNSSGNKSRISACVIISTPWNLEHIKISLEGKWLNKKLYVNFLLKKIKETVKRNVAILSQHPDVNIDKVLKASTFSELDSNLTIRMYGFPSIEAYYKHCCIQNQLQGIQVPFVSIMAMDDPFAPYESIPLTEFEANPNTLLVLTRYGGHFGFVEGVFPRGYCWMDKVLSQFLAAMKQNEIY